MEKLSACSKALCKQQQHAAVSRARGDAHRVARDRDRQLEEAARHREEQRIAAARHRARVRQEERERRELARYRNGTL